MPEGDTIHRTSAVLHRLLAGERVLEARGRPGGVQLERVVGSRVTGVRPQGKHVLMSFDVGLVLHTHMRMKGSWHRYRPGERWRIEPSRAVAVVAVARMVAVCFDAPTVELLDSRALALHPSLARLGPDLLAEEPDIEGALARLTSPAFAGVPVGEAILDQTAVAGLGNVYRSEVLFIERLDPSRPTGDVPRADLERVLRTGARLLAANTGGGDRVTMPDATGAEPGSGVGRPSTARWVYRRAGLPCRRCGTPVRSATVGRLPRRLYWCPTCQGPAPPKHEEAPAR